MNFLIKRPCAHCPFRRDCTPFLRRARQIAQQMQDDHFWFACHETTGAKNGRRIRKADRSHCAGLMNLLWRARRPNIAMRLALAFKLITVDQLQARRPAVFRSLEEFARHHERSR